MNINLTQLVTIGNKGTLFTSGFNADENYYRELKKLLKIRRVKDCPFTRVGKAFDGGYIMVDSFQKWGGVAYSFGIAGDVSWDYDMVKRGYEIFMYDMTIDALPWNHKNFHFFKEGIAGKKIEEEALDTLENFVARNGHENSEHMILKMDVEGAEWGFLAAVSSELLNRFDQMVFEFHDMTKPKTSAEMEATFAAFRKINATHTPVHIHGNNGGGFLTLEGLGIFPDVPEITYVRNENHEFEDDDEICLPIGLDEPNNPHLPEIPLGYWNK